jgi:hypothetical protein
MGKVNRGLKIGRQKTGGRQKGTCNKNKALIRTFCDYIVNNGYEKFETEFNKLEGEKYIKLFLQFSKIFTNENYLLSANEKIIKYYKKNETRIKKRAIR